MAAHRKKRILTAVLCAVLAALFLFSSAFVSVHFYHECAGGKCSVCAILSSWERLLRSAALVIPAAMLLLALRFKAEALRTRFCGCPALSLVCLKVKLTD